MALERVKAIKTSDGTTFLNESEAQIHELELLLEVDNRQGEAADAERVAIKTIVEKKTEVLAILSTRKPRAPKAKRAKKEQVAA